MLLSRTIQWKDRQVTTLQCVLSLITESGTVCFLVLPQIKITMKDEPFEWVHDSTTKD